MRWYHWFVYLVVFVFCAGMALWTQPRHENLIGPKYLQATVVDRKLDADDESSNTFWSCYFWARLENGELVQFSGNDEGFVAKATLLKKGDRISLLPCVASWRSVPAVSTFLWENFFGGCIVENVPPEK